MVISTLPPSDTATPEEVAHFLARANPDPSPKGCWFWGGYCEPAGYGKSYFRKKVWRTHQIYYMLWIGDIPVGLEVMHTCDARNCVNPDHLLVGTHYENMMDMIRKGRNCHGANHPSAKLTDSQVDDIRRRFALGEDSLSLAMEYHIGKRHIYRIVNGESWRLTVGTPPIIGNIAVPSCVIQTTISADIDAI